MSWEYASVLFKFINVFVFSLNFLNSLIIITIIILCVCVCLCPEFHLCNFTGEHFYSIQQYEEWAFFFFSLSYWWCFCGRAYKYLILVCYWQNLFDFRSCKAEGVNRTVLQIIGPVYSFWSLQLTGNLCCVIILEIFWSFLGIF